MIEFVQTLSLILILVLAGVVLAKILLKLYQTYRRTQFCNEYNIDSIPAKIIVKKRNSKSEMNYYHLSYPYWEYSKKDGTADLRRQDNEIIWQKSRLTVHEYELISIYPEDIISVVHKLRKIGITIELCAEERKKAKNIKHLKEILQQCNDIDYIISTYSQEPAGFELFCANLFEHMGYKAEVTPPTNDGGYDILLKGEKRKAIVECKCYSLDHKVGRPMVQKLVGANSVVCADHMIFVTTSEFSLPASQYARDLNIELIDGKALLNLIKLYLYPNSNKEIEVTEKECRLTVTDLADYIPSDIYRKFYL